MKARAFPLLIVIALFLSACNLPSNLPTETPLPPSPTVESTAVPPTETPEPTLTALPTETALPTATGTPTVPIAWPTDVNVNCRFGPSTDWMVVGALLTTQTATISGKNSTGTWWFVTTPNSPNTPCWVAASVTTTAGNLAGLPVVAPPTASVTKVTIEKPDDISIAGCFGPANLMKLKGSIEMNGPGEVKWHFETQQGGSLSTGTTTFSSSGSQTVSDDTFTPTVAIGTYWVRLVVTSPNSKQAEASYKIECP
jgi:hypothetical protein